MSDNSHTSPPSANDPQQSAPVCESHPDTIAYVRCQRCDRAICGKCQVPAPVGFQCQSCVQTATHNLAQNNLSVEFSGRPIVTIAIMVMCCVVAAAQMVIPGLTNSMAFVPALGATEPWRALTAAFAHQQISLTSPFSILHLAFNMYWLWNLGVQLERLMGRWLYALLYLASILGGSLAFALISGPFSVVNGQTYYSSAVGASGAIFGLCGALLAIGRLSGQDIKPMLYFLAIATVMGFLIPNVAWDAHLGGLIIGAVMGAVFTLRFRQKWPAAVTWISFVAITAVSSAALWLVGLAQG